MNRGFDSSLGPVKGGDHFTQVSTQCNCPAVIWKGGVATEGSGICSNHTKRPLGGSCVDLWKDHGPASHLNGTVKRAAAFFASLTVFGCAGTFTGYIYTRAAVDIIGAHPASDPLFLYLAFQVTHAPLEAPARFQRPSFWPSDRTLSRLQLNGMAAALDEGVANVTAALHTAGLWEHTLFVFSADNGGEIGSAGNNWP